MTNLTANTHQHCQRRNMAKHMRPQSYPQPVLVMQLGVVGYIEVRTFFPDANLARFVPRRDQHNAIWIKIF